jgi:hypothetical protein
MFYLISRMQEKILIQFSFVVFNSFNVPVSNFDNIRTTWKDRMRIKSDWGTLIPRINVKNGIKLGFILE